MKHHKRCVWAAGVIRKYYIGWTVRKEYRRKFRAIAGPRIVKFMLNAHVSLCSMREEIYVQDYPLLT